MSVKFDIKQVMARRQAWIDSLQNEETPSSPLFGLSDPKKRKSRPFCVRAYCFECVGGFSDPGPYDRVKACEITRCALWPIRPYRSPAQKSDESTAALQCAAELPPIEKGQVLSAYLRHFYNPLNRPLAIKAECGDCQGNGKNTNTQRLVAECASAMCPLWDVRPWQSLLESGQESVPETEDEDQDENEPDNE